MKKILYVNDSNQVDTSPIEFACYIAKLTNSGLTGFFPEKFFKDEVSVISKLYGIPEVDTISGNHSFYSKTSKSTLEKNITFFNDACIKGNVSSSIHRNTGEPVKELITESRFADLLIVNASMPGGENAGNVPPGFVKDVLAASECPTIIAPKHFAGINEVVIAYDGSASSVFAIKQFTYLFPELEDKKTMVIEVDIQPNERIEQKHKINELLSPHYSNIGFQDHEGNSDNELFDYLLSKKKIFLVMGGSGYSIFSRLFKPVKTINHPIFIAQRQVQAHHSIDGVFN